MKIKADLHNHLSTFSNIPREFNKTIDITKKRLGTKGILGIINTNDKRYETFSNLSGYDRENIGNALYIPKKDIWVLRGQEVFTKQGHLIVVGLEAGFNLQNNRNLEDSLKESKDNKGIIIAVHSFFIGGIGPYLIKNHKLLKYFDGIEVRNGEAFYGNKKAKMFYELIKDDFDLGALSFSDGHSLYEIGNCYTSLNNFSFNDSEELNNNLRESIKQHKKYSKDKQHFSFLGSLEHSLKFAPIAAFSKIKN